MAKVARKPEPNPIARPFTKELLLLAVTTSVSTVGPLKTTLCVADLCVQN